MRLNRLDLVRYGKFTGRSIGFGEAVAGRPDFHIVHGPNEAGKSTLFSGYLDLLFGIEKTSGYGFLHGYPVMRVAGDLTIGGVRHEVHRLKRNQGSLVAADDRVLPDTLFSPVLAGMDRSTYRMMFSLDDDSIEKGGEAILKNEGELGAMLFSASSGLSGMAAELARMKAEAEEFYKPQGRKHGLSVLKAEIEALKEERKDRDVAARDYGVLSRNRDLAAARYDEAFAARGETRAAIEALERRLAALPLLSRLRALRARLAGFDLGETPPADWTALAARLSREEAELSSRSTRIDTERDRWTGELADLAQDPDVLALEADVSDLAGSALEARYRTAAMDMAARIDERDRIGAEISQRLAALGLPPATDPETLMLAPELADALTAHFARRSGLVERLASARREAGEAARALSSAADAAERPGGGDGGGDDADRLANLSAMVRAVRSGGLAGRMREAQRLVAARRQELDVDLAELAPWEGDVGDLRALAVPPRAGRDEIRAALEASRESRRRLAEQTGELDVELAARRAALAKLLQSGAPAGDDEALALRRARDAAWHAHRAGLDAATADAFEAAMRRDDDAASERLLQSGRLSEIRLLERAIAEGEARLAVLRKQAEAAEGDLARAQADVESLAAALRLPASFGLDGVDAWIACRDQALESHAALDKANAESALLEKEARETAARLRTLLGSDEDIAGLDELLALAEDRVAALLAAQAKRATVEDALRQARLSHEERAQAFEDARAALAAWQESWDARIAGTWLAGDAAPSGPERLGALLPVLQAVAKLVESRRDYDHRIAGMQRDQSDYRTLSAGLAGRLGQAFDPENPLAATGALSARLDTAKETEGRRQRLLAELSKLDDEEEELARLRSVHAARAGEICGFLGCETLGEAVAILERHARREEIVERIAEAGRDLCRQVPAQTVEEAEAALAAVDEPQLVAERADLQARFEEQDREVRDLHSARLKAADELAKVGEDDAGARIEERRRTAIVEIAERARGYLASRAGILAAEQALRLYRERHRSAMMRRASDAFRLISGGEYSGLATLAEKDSELLIANAASGGSKLARDLSKGTRFQLYLALRVAGYREIAASREILPFIADDIMETFDDGRALNTFRLMGEMALTGQVIYLTHHQHLRDLAREACPEVTIHEL